MKNSSTDKKVIKKKVSKKKEVNNKSKDIVNKELIFSRYLTKVNITYFIFFLMDIILVIYLARGNKVNYVLMFEEEIFVSKTKYLLWGRNYVNVIVTAFFYIYGCLLNRFYLRRKNTKKFLILLLGILLIVNNLLFIIFTKKIY